MRARLDNPSVLPWQFPQLEQAIAPASPMDPEPAPAEELGLPVAKETVVSAPEPPILPVRALEPVRQAPIPASPAPVPPVPAPLIPAPLPTTTIERLLEEGRALGYRDGHAQGASEGHAEGFAQGLAEGTQAAAAALSGQAQRLESLIEHLSEPIPALEGIVEQSIAALVLEIARAVIGGEVLRTREHMVRLIREALSKVPIGTGRPRLLLNPSDIELVRKLAPDIEEQGTTLVPDDTIEPGGCVVVADTDGDEDADRRWHPRAGEGLSQVDLTLASRWRSVIHALFQGEDD